MGIAGSSFTDVPTAHRQPVGLQSEYLSTGPLASCWFARLTVKPSKVELMSPPLLGPQSILGTDTWEVLGKQMSECVNK